MNREVLKTKAALWVAWHLPRWLVYFCGIRLWVHATGGKWGDTVVPEVRMDTCIRRWED